MEGGCKLWFANVVVQVKKVEDVVYDLSLRNLIPKGSAAAWFEGTQRIKLAYELIWNNDTVQNTAVEEFRFATPVA